MEGSPGRAFELPRRCSTIRLGILHDAASAFGCLAVELGDVYTRLEAERLLLSHEWRHLELTINFGRLQHKHACTEAEESLVATKEARDRVLEEARAADCRCEAIKKRWKELQASNAALKRQVQAHKAALATSGDGPSMSEARLDTLEDTLTLEALEQSQEREQLEVMEHQVAAA